MDNLKESQQITKTKKTRGRKNSPILEPITENVEQQTVSTGFAVQPVSGEEIAEAEWVSKGETLVRLAELRIYNGAQLAKELGMPVHRMRKLAKDNNYIIPKADKVSKHKPKIMALYNLGITRAVICKVLGISYVIVQAAVGSENPSIYEELTREGAIERAEALIAALRD